MVIKAHHAALIQKIVEPVLLLIPYKLPWGLVWDRGFKFNLVKCITKSKGKKEEEEAD